jgi:hypothetical protein
MRGMPLIERVPKVKNDASPRLKRYHLVRFVIRKRNDPLFKYWTYCPPRRGSLALQSVIFLVFACLAQIRFICGTEPCCPMYRHRDETYQRVRTLIFLLLAKQFENIN